MTVESFLSRFVASLAARAVVSLANLPIRDNRASEPPALPSLETVRSALGNHLVEINAWAEELSFLGRDPARLPLATIDLQLSSIPRRFRGQTEPDILLSEEQLYRSVENFLLLGDPGAGKTTTLKRIAHRVFTTEDNDLIDFVILYRLRQLLPGPSLCARIAHEVFGLSIEEHTFKESPSEFTVNGLEPITALASLVGTARALLLFDGIDEIPDAGLRASAIQEIGALASRAPGTRIIATCRSGDYNFILQRFKIAEISPLTEDQIASVAARWLGSPDKFLAVLSSQTYGEIANRPLFLGQLLLLFEREGQLPRHPSAVYKNVIRLLLTDWNEANFVTRRSQYTTFQVSEKADFLAYLAFELLLKRGTQRFTDRDLVDTYRLVHARFDLPRDQAREVVREIESHTGIIVQSGYDHFEFSHLTLQEYLAAEYLVRRPGLDEYVNSFRRHPAVTAIAVALSTDPDELFLRIVQSFVDFEHGNLGAFLDRIALEQPRFAGDDQLGRAVLLMALTVTERHTAGLSRFLSLPAAKRAVADALRKGAFEWSGDCRVKVISGVVADGPGRSLTRPEFTIRPPIWDLLCQHGEVRSSPCVPGTKLHILGSLNSQE